MTSSSSQRRTDARSAPVASSSASSATSSTSLELARSGDGIGEAIDRIEIAEARAQLLPLAHVARGAEDEAQLAVLSEHLRAVDLEPRVRAVRAAQPDSDRVDVRADAELLAGGCRDAEIVGVDQILERYAGKLARIPADREPRRRRVDDRAHEVAEDDEVVRALDDEPPNGVVDVLGRARERLGPAARRVPPSSASWLVGSLHYPAADGQQIPRGDGELLRREAVTRARAPPQRACVGDAGSEALDGGGRMLADDLQRWSLLGARQLAE